MKRKFYFALALVLILVLTASLFSCGSTNPENTGASGTEPAETTTAPGTTAPATEAVIAFAFTDYDGKTLLCNRFRSTLPAPFSLYPGVTEERGSGYYSYGSVYEYIYHAYLALLESEGFTLAKTSYEAFLIRDDCMVHCSYIDQSLGEFWYQRSPYAPENGISEEEAAAHLIPEDTLSPIALHPIDLTPEGFFELTGGQIFVYPIYSFDTYAAMGHPEMMMPENEDYSLRVVFMKDEIVCEVTYDKLAVFDVDGDGDTEVCTLSPGPTSGLPSVTVNVVSDGKLYSQFFYYLEPGMTFIRTDDGAIRLHRTYGPPGTTYEQDLTVVFDPSDPVNYITLADEEGRIVASLHSSIEIDPN